jgi:hypothetical protein
VASIPEEAVHLLEGRHLAHLATVMLDGSPQVTPIWIGHDGDYLAGGGRIGEYLALLRGIGFEEEDRNWCRSTLEVFAGRRSDVPG